MSFKFYSTLIAAIFIATPSTSFSKEGIDLLENTPRIIIRDEIVPGYESVFLKSIHQAYVSGHLPHLVVDLRSRGGNVVEAMKIGMLVKQLKLRTYVVNGNCLSACALIFLAGNERIAAIGSVGVHRPKYDPAQFAMLDEDSAKAKYSQLTSLTSQYLKFVGAKPQLIDLMLSTPSTEMTYLDESNMHLIPTYSDATSEWLAARCGTASQTDLILNSKDAAGALKLESSHQSNRVRRVQEIYRCHQESITFEAQSAAEKYFSNSNFKKKPL